VTAPVPREESSLVTYLRLLGYLRPYIWPQGVLTVLTMLAYSSVETGIPFALKFGGDHVFADGLSAQQRQEGLRLLAGAVLGLAMLRGMLSYVTSYLGSWIGMRVVTDMRNDLTSRLQSLDQAFFNRTRTGQITARVTADCMLVRAAVTDAVKSIFRDTTSLIGLVGAAFVLDWRLAVLALIGFPFAVLPLRMISRRLRRVSRDRQRFVGKLNALLQENVQGSRVVKVFGREHFEATRLKREAERIFRESNRATRVRSFPLTDILAGIGVATVLWVGGQSVLAGSRTQGSFIAFVGAVVLLYDPVKKLVAANYTVQQGLAGAERVFGLIDLEAEVRDPEPAIELDGVRTGIEFDHVDFEYELGRPVLKDVSFRLDRGSMVALVGESGGGKSTIADLIPRLYDVTAGRVLIDGHDVRTVSLQSLRAQMAVVTQVTFLFNDSVRNNIAYGEPDRPLADVIAAAKAANAHHFIEALSRGYETHVGDLGVRLSGGQRQRIAIARAILRDAPILLLDEATSSLDTESEQIVQEALDRLMTNRTTLVVAHRLSTIRRADEILVVVGGRIVERGTHEQLLALGGDYRRLHDRQAGEEPPPIVEAPTVVGT
jgi:subfamily B ATP-binding cassette protein MsbA